MAFKTFTPGVLTSSDVNTFLMRQSIIVCTSATRPASPNEGMFIYETDTDNLAKFDGSNFVYQGKYDYSFEPDLIGVGWTFKGYQSFSKVAFVGDLVHYLGYILWDGTGSQVAGNPILVDLPVDAAAGPTAFSRLSQRGVFVMQDESLPAQMAGSCRINSATRLFITPHVTDPGISPNIGAAGIDSTYITASGKAPTDADDKWFWSIIYEAA